MSSCNADPIKLEINPIITVGCTFKKSCNALFVKSLLSLEAVKRQW